MQTIIIKGNIIHTPTKDKLECIPNGYLVSVDNKIQGIFTELPAQYAGVPVRDYGDALIVPGFCDIHVHAPQYVFRGLGLDLQLMDWLNAYTFPVESRFADPEYARIYYNAFVSDLAKNGTTRAVVFATIHPESTKILMDLMEQKRVGGLVGKVCMDTLSPDYLCETAAESLEATEKWLQETRSAYELVKPTVTPRFIPTCTSELLEGLGALAAKYDVPIHSHISEDLGEMEVSRGRYPEYDNDGVVYDHFGLLNDKTIMAHFIYPTDHELALIRERGVTIAHCPQSHGNVAAGMPSLRRMIDEGLKLGLGSDIAAGCSVSMLRAMSDAIYMSKLVYLASEKKDAFLTVSEALYLATKGGGQIFGKVGSFEEGYELDVNVIDDRSLNVCADKLTLEERIERVIHLGDDRNFIARYTAGVEA